MLRRGYRDNFGAAEAARAAQELAAAPSLSWRDLLTEPDEVIEQSYELLRCMSPLLALNGHRNLSSEGPLLGRADIRRTSRTRPILGRSVCRLSLRSTLHGHLLIAAIASVRRHLHALAFITHQPHRSLRGLWIPSLLAVDGNAVLQIRLSQIVALKMYLIE
jgi:hypothetical protein